MQAETNEGKTRREPGERHFHADANIYLSITPKATATPHFSGRFVSMYINKHDASVIPGVGIRPYLCEILLKVPRASARSAAGVPVLVVAVVLPVTRDQVRVFVLVEPAAPAIPRKIQNKPDEHPRSTVNVDVRCLRVHCTLRTYM